MANFEQNLGVSLDRRFGLRTWEPSTFNSKSPCHAPAVSGKKRCRMHGGAAGVGAPKGNQNALKQGIHTAEQRELNKQIRNLIREGKEIVEKC